jgi:hypothetical protein
MDSNDSRGDDRLRRSRIADEIRAEMARQRITAPDLLDTARLDIKMPTLRNRLNGKSPFYYEELALILRALGVGFSDFHARVESHQ